MVLNEQSYPSNRSAVQVLLCVCVTVFSCFLTVGAPQVSLSQGSHVSVL